MDMENCFGQMALFIKGTGKKEFSMEKVYLKVLMGLRNMAIGSKEKKLFLKKTKKTDL